LIDDRSASFDINNREKIALLCNRHFGIGADGLMLLRNVKGYDFEMFYFNADGAPGSMCGNGARCLSRFAVDIGVTSKSTLSFLAHDGSHEAELGPNTIRLKMIDVHDYSSIGDDMFVNTGSPHYVRFVEDVRKMNVFETGHAIRYSSSFSEKGINVNFIEPLSKCIFVRTYERGVEDETLSCGTGVTASALMAAIKGHAPPSGSCTVETLGGKLTVHYRQKNNHFTDIWLEGPAEFVFKGEFAQ
jgi:diaminopimelate epimerase